MSREDWILIWQIIKSSSPPPSPNPIPPSDSRRPLRATPKVIAAGHWGHLSSFAAKTWITLGCWCACLKHTRSHWSSWGSTEGQLLLRMHLSLGDRKLQRQVFDRNDQFPTVFCWKLGCDWRAGFSLKKGIGFFHQKKNRQNENSGKLDFVLSKRQQNPKLFSQGVRYFDKLLYFIPRTPF